MARVMCAILLVVLAACAAHGQEASKKLAANGTRFDAKAGKDVALGEWRVGIGPATLKTMVIPVEKGNFKFNGEYDLYQLDSDSKQIGVRGRVILSDDGKSLTIEHISITFDGTTTVRLVARQLKEPLMVAAPTATGN